MMYIMAIYVFYKGKWIIKGDLSIYTRTVSNYDDCRLLHLPSVRLSLAIKWNTPGNPNAHHDVMPCAPNKIPDFSHGVSYTLYCHCEYLMWKII
mgnify:CR=1 FL=1